MNNIYDAIMKAAQSIESQPRLYCFWENKIGDCNTPHCILGWIGIHLGLTKGSWRDVQTILGLPAIGPLTSLNWESGVGNGDWHNADDVARFMRTKLAPRFKPVHSGLPSSVRDIFRVTA